MPEYAALVRDVVDGASSDPDGDIVLVLVLVLVGQFSGGYTAARVASERSVQALVLVHAMIPAPGETAGAGWSNVGQEQAGRQAAELGGYPTEFDEQACLLHDVDPAVEA